MALPVLPRAQAPIAGQLPTTIEWYNFFRDLRAFVIENEGDVAQIDDILARLAALEAEEDVFATIQGPLSVAVFGSLESGNVTVQLINDADLPGNTYYYGTGPTGTKGWSTVASAFTAAQPGIELVTGADGVTDIRPDDDLEAVEALAGTGLAARTAANTWATRSMAVNAGSTAALSWTNADAVAGNPTIAIEASLNSLAGLAVVQGDILYGSAAETIARLAKDTNATRYLSNTGASNNPAWAQINLANGVTGDLPFANLAQGSALSVLGVTGNAVADNASIVAGSDHQVLRRSGTAVAFGAVNLASSNAVTGALPAANIAISGYIDGLIMQWVSATALTVTSGSAYIESTGAILASASAIAKSSLSLSASTWYHVYLYSNAGTPDIEIVTTAPVLYNGTARSKSGDTSRRYVGSVRTNSSGNLFRFIQVENGIFYYGDIGGAGTGEWRVLSGGTATVSTTVSMSGLLPVTSTMARVRAFNTADVVFRIDNSNTGNTAPAALFSLSAGNVAVVNAFAEMPTDSSQAVTYFMGAGRTVGGGFIDVLGYIYER